VAPGRDRDLISIGRFGRLANLSPRQLRYYHALGLLTPAAVDPSSGYRYYAEAQRTTAELIALLRSIDMPVPEIQSLLADRSPDNVRAVFDRLRTSIEERLEHAREMLDRIDGLVPEEAVMEQRQTRFPFEAFSLESRDVLQLAQQLAEDAGHGHIGPEHLLAALASGSAGRAGAALRGLGVDTGTVVAVIVAEPASGPPLPNRGVRDVIAAAFAAAGVDAATAGAEVIDTSNLLRCTLRSEAAAAVLQGRGVTAAQVLSRLQ
jgi:DNA-binding transcriptional MerR regulator